MAIISGFFNSVNGDRKYDTNDISSLFEGIFADGVFKTVGNNFMVKASGGMTVTIDTGKGWFNKHFIENTALLPQTLNDSEVILDRIDAYVLDVDDNDSVRFGNITYVKGTPSSDPQKPELIQSEKQNQHPIAYITVRHGVTEITDADIEIMVGKSECPFAVGVIDGIDVDNLFVQWEAEFGQWFETVKGQLSEDAAGNLQNQINEIKDVREAALSTTWEGDEETGYHQTISVAGISENDRPVIDVKLIEGNKIQNDLIREERNKITDVWAHEGSITVYASEQTTIELTLIVKGV